MNFAPYLLALGLSLGLAPTGSLSAQRNVLLVVADDLGTDRLSAYGEGTALPSTPTIDALAADGVLFENCWANPVCSPTRATIQTGRYSFRTGVGTVIPLAPALALDELTLAEALDELGTGHATATIGKWHLGGNTLTILGALNPNLQGYDHFAGSIPGAFVGPFDYEFWRRTEDGVTSLSRTYATTQNVDDSLEWITQQDGPWFLNLCFNAPHTPFHAPPAGLHTQDLPASDPCQEPIPFHDAMVEALDTELGRLLASLAPELLANTSVILVGDNGTTEAVAQAPLEPDKAKGTLYQGGIRVPLIISGPEVALPGRSSSDLVNCTDLFATIIELAGGDVSQLSTGAPADSLSLVPLLQSPTASSARSYAYSEVFVRPLVGGAQPPASPPAASGSGCIVGGTLFVQGQTIRGPRFKLIQFADGTEEFYDLLGDPLESSELLGAGPLSGLTLAAYLNLKAQLSLLLAQ